MSTPSLTVAMSMKISVGGGSSPVSSTGEGHGQTVSWKPSVWNAPSISAKSSGAAIHQPGQLVTAMRQPT